MIGPRWRAAALLAAVLVLGVMLGAWGHRMLRPWPFGPRGRPSREVVVARLSKKLDLSPAQRDSVKAILDRHHPAMDSLWREYRPRFQELQRMIGSEIEAQLEPRQREKFAELTRRMEQRRGPTPPSGEPDDGPH
jgi:Spy/CpxP family protein refolding chaperone